MIRYSCCLVAQSCPTLCDPMDCSPPGSSVHEILQARRLELVAMRFFQFFNPSEFLKEISPGSSLEGMMLKAETPVFWPAHAKSWLIGKYSNAGRDWGQEEQETTEDEMAGWHHRLDGHEFGWTLGVCDGQGGLACCGSWSRIESDTTTQLNWTELNLIFLFLPQLPVFLVSNENEKKKKKHCHNQWHGAFPCFVLEVL